MPKGACLICWLLLSASLPGHGQEGTNVPPITLLRAADDYSFLRNNDSVKLFLGEVKYLPLSKQANYFVSIGGGYRARFEHTSNKDYSTENETHYSQRLDLNISAQLGARFRLFGELYHGLLAPGQSFLESDAIDLHQAFVDVNVLSKIKGSATLRLGRQEIGYGASRLVGIREGPNMRRSFDMGRLLVRRSNISLDVFYGKEVLIQPEAFDNKSGLFDEDTANPTIWGFYYRQPFLKEVGKLDVYYFGFHSNSSRFNDVVGEELRHAVGIRSFGSKGRLSYNTELIVQVGQLAESDIFAWNLETDWSLALWEENWRPTLGIKVDWSSGDRAPGDGKIGTFNPMFVNPAIYSLAAVNTPANIISLHPNLTLRPDARLSVLLDYAFFYRTQSADGLYTPPRFLVREAAGETARHIGDVFGLQVQYTINRAISFDLRASYFISGKFIELTGDANDIFYVAPTLSFKF